LQTLLLVFLEVVFFKVSTKHIKALCKK